jgi:hypothetical protein
MNSAPAATISHTGIPTPATGTISVASSPGVKAGTGACDAAVVGKPPGTEPSPAGAGLTGPVSAGGTVDIGAGVPADTLGPGGLPAAPDAVAEPGGEAGGCVVAGFVGTGVGTPVGVELGLGLP